MCIGAKITASMAIIRKTLLVDFKTESHGVYRRLMLKEYKNNVYVHFFESSGYA
jgi:hypothetical protein